MMQDFADDFYKRTCYTVIMVIYGTASAGEILAGAFSMEELWDTGRSAMQSRSGTSSSISCANCSIRERTDTCQGNLKHHVDTPVAQHCVMAHTVRSTRQSLTMSIIPVTGTEMPVGSILQIGGESCGQPNSAGILCVKNALGKEGTHPPEWLTISCRSDSVDGHWIWITYKAYAGAATVPSPSRKEAASVSVPGRGSQISTGFCAKTGVGSHAKNREIKWGIDPRFQDFREINLKRRCGRWPTVTAALVPAQAGRKKHCRKSWWTEIPARLH